MEAESLVRDDHLMQELARKYSFSAADKRTASASAASSATPAIDAHIQNAFPKIKRVHDWLMHQPTIGTSNVSSAIAMIMTTDCEASAENTGE